MEDGRTSYQDCLTGGIHYFDYLLTPSASHLTYLLLATAKLWLHHRQIRMEDNSQDVAAGKLIDKTSYRRRARRWTQLAFEGIKIDHFDARERVVMETKKESETGARPRSAGEVLPVPPGG